MAGSPRNRNPKQDNIAKGKIEGGSEPFSVVPATSDTGPEKTPEEERKGQEGQEWLEKDYIELIQDHYKKLFFEEDNLKRVLEENGLKTLAPRIKKTQKLLEADEVAKNCLNYTLEILSKKYKDRAEKLEKAILENELDQIPEIKDETTKAILVYYRYALEAVLEKTKSEKKRGIIDSQIKKVGILLGEVEPDTNGLKVDKSGENLEQKELRKKIRQLIEEAVEENVAKIDSLAKETKNLEVDKTELEQEKKKIKKQILENLDGHTGLILQYLGNDYKNPDADQMIRIEARRMVVNAFARSQEMGKILPRGKISREVDLKEITPAVSVERTPRVETARSGEIEINKDIMNIENIKREKDISSPDKTAPKTPEFKKEVKPFSPDDVFWNKNRKAMLEDIKAEIDRRSWLDENKIENPEKAKAIPEIGVDLRAATINRMLREEYNGVEPETEKSHEIMTELHEMWAKQWLDYLEKQRYGGKTAGEEKPVSTETSPEGVAPVSKAETTRKTGEESDKIRVRRRTELDEGQKKIFSELIRKAEVGKLKKALQGRYEGVDPEKR